MRIAEFEKAEILFKKISDLCISEKAEVGEVSFAAAELLIGTMILTNVNKKDFLEALAAHWDSYVPVAGQLEFDFEVEPKEDEETEILVDGVVH